MTTDPAPVTDELLSDCRALMERLRCDVPGFRHYHDSSFVPDISAVNSLKEDAHDAIERAVSKVKEQAAEIERLREALNRYRYATQWTAADAWDFCSDCQERIRWAHAHDPERLSVNDVAAVGKTFLARSALPEER